MFQFTNNNGRFSCFRRQRNSKSNKKKAPDLNDLYAGTSKANELTEQLPVVSDLKNRSENTPQEMDRFPINAIHPNLTVEQQLVTSSLRNSSEDGVQTNGTQSITVHSSDYSIRLTHPLTPNENVEAPHISSANTLSQWTDSATLSTQQSLTNSQIADNLPKKAQTKRSMDAKISTVPSMMWTTSSALLGVNYAKQLRSSTTGLKMDQATRMNHMDQGLQTPNWEVDNKKGFIVPVTIPHDLVTDSANTTFQIVVFPHPSSETAPFIPSNCPNLEPEHNNPAEQREFCRCRSPSLCNLPRESAYITMSFPPISNQPSSADDNAKDNN